MRTILFLLLVVAAPVLGQGTRVYVTEFGRRVLQQADQIIEAEVTRVHNSFRGISTARLVVKKRLFGYDRNEAITLLYIEDYVAPDAFNATLDRSTVQYERRRKAGLNVTQKEETTRTSETKKTRESTRSTDRRGRGSGVRLAAKDAGLFFLKRKGASYSLVGFLPERDMLYAFKRDRLIAVIGLEAYGALDIRASRAKRFFLDSLKSDNVWERGNSAREVMYLARRYRDEFDKADVDRIVKLLFGEEEPPIQASLERAVRAVDADLALVYAKEAESRARQKHAKSLDDERKLLQNTRVADLRAADLGRIARRYRRAATGLLSDFLKDRAPIVRERAAQALAQLAAPSARQPLREALAKETDKHASLAMVYACGVGGDPLAVPVVARRLKESHLERAAAQALARIGTPAARDALVSHRGRADPDTQQLIDDLLREEFAERS